MALCWHLSTSYFLFLSFTTSLCVQLILEKGSKTTISCNFNKKEISTVWQVRAGKQFVNLANCTFANHSCVVHMPERYTAEVLDVSDGYQTNLIIASVRANETHFRCIGKYNDETKTLEVYTDPKHPTCDPVDVDSTKKYIQFKCRANNVHPSLDATLTIREVALSQRDVLIHCTNEKHDNLHHEGHSAECIIRIPAGKLEPNTYSYFVKMFPHISNTSGINVPFAVTQDYTFTLSIPKVSIDDKQCSLGPAVVNGKVIPKSKASCRCVLEDTGFPPGRAFWFTHFSSLSKNIDVNGSSTVVIFYESPGQRYECRAWSPLKNTNSPVAEYLPIFEERSESGSVRVEIAVGIVTCSIALTAIAAVVVWKWRIRRRQQADAISITYSKPSTENGHVAEKPETSGDNDRLLN